MVSYDPNSDEFLKIQLENYGLSAILINDLSYPNILRLRELSTEFSLFFDSISQDDDDSMSAEILRWKKLNYRWNRIPKIVSPTEEQQDILKSIIDKNEFDDIYNLSIQNNTLVKGDIISFEYNGVKIGLVKEDENFTILVLNADGVDYALPLPIYYGVLLTTPANYWNTYHQTIHYMINMSVVFDKIVWDPETYDNKPYLIGRVPYNFKLIKIVYPLTEDQDKELKQMIEEEIEPEVVDYGELDEDEIDIFREEIFLGNNRMRGSSRFAIANNLDDNTIYSNRDELYNIYKQDQLTIFVPLIKNINERQYADSNDVSNFDTD
jgi:hypothetical protein